MNRSTPVRDIDYILSISKAFAKAPTTRHKDRAVSLYATTTSTHHHHIFEACASSNNSMPAIQLYRRDTSSSWDTSRLLPAIIIGSVAVILIFIYVMLRNRAIARHGLGTNRVFSGRTPFNYPVDDRSAERRRSDAARVAEDERRREVIRRAEERRRLEDIYMQQLNRELLDEQSAEPKPPGYAPSNVDGANEITRPIPAAGREGDELPSYAPRTRRVSDAAMSPVARVQAQLDDEDVERVASDPPPAYSPAPASATSPPPPAVVAAPSVLRSSGLPPNPMGRTHV